MLPLPYVIDDDAIQGNFDAIKQQFPLTRKDLKLEAPHIVGAAGEPTFQNGWVNYNTATYYGARFWKDSTGIVYVQGLIKDGTIATTVFVLPAGYRPSNGLIFPADTNGGHGRLDVAATGNVVAQTPIGGNLYYSLSTISFRQES